MSGTKTTELIAEARWMTGGEKPDPWQIVPAEHFVSLVSRLADALEFLTAPTDAELGALLARWDDTERPDGWNSGDEHHLADLLITALRSA